MGYVRLNQFRRNNLTAKQILKFDETTNFHSTERRDSTDHNQQPPPISSNILEQKIAFVKEVDTPSRRVIVSHNRGVSLSSANNNKGVISLTKGH
jgi:hypothetical protein